MSQSPKYNLGACWTGHRIKRTGWEHSMGLTLILVAIHLCRITCNFPKRQADQEIEGRLDWVSSKTLLLLHKIVTLGLMFECMWCKTIMSHPSCSTLFFPIIPLAFLLCWHNHKIAQCQAGCPRFISVFFRLETDERCRRARAYCEWDFVWSPLVAPGCHGNMHFSIAEKGRRSTGCARLCFVQQLDLGWLLTALNTLKSPACQSLGAAGMTDSATWQADYNAREFLTLVLRVISLSEADAVPLVKLHDRRELGEGHLPTPPQTSGWRDPSPRTKQKLRLSRWACSSRFPLSFSSAVAQEKRPSWGCPISNAWQRCLFRARFR